MLANPVTLTLRSPGMVVQKAGDPSKASQWQNDYPPVVSLRARARGAVSITLKLISIDLQTSLRVWVSITQLGAALCH